jgi:UPF0755 protein
MYKYQKKNRINKNIIITILIVIVVAVFYCYSRYQYFLNTPVDNASTETTVITINKGDHTAEIAKKLAEENLIIDQDTFKLYTRLNNLDKEIRVGRFSVSPNQTIPEIVKTITSDQQIELIITIPEGYNTAQIDQLLTNQKLIKTGDFKTAVKNFQNYDDYAFLEQTKIKDLIYPLEGYLFPDTYYVDPQNFSGDKLIIQMLDNFKNKTKNLNPGSNRSWSEIINVASMVEEETNRDQDRPIVSGIIWKRLQENWFLGIDATLLYLREDSDREIDYFDLKKDSPYNTRNHLGLPPGPIANPGLASIEAALNPQQTDYYYYLTSKDGEMIYATSESEHNNNKNKYL